MLRVVRLVVAAVVVALCCASNVQANARVRKQLGLSMEPPLLLANGNVLAILTATASHLDEIEAVLAEDSLDNLIALAIFSSPEGTYSQTWEFPARLSTAPLRLIFLQSIVSGTLPTQLGLQTALGSLIIASNEDLGGTIPSQLGKLSQLQQLRLFSNPGLSGTIPTQLGVLSSLVSLDLGETALTGTIPSQLGLLTNLETWLMERTAVVGSLPEQLGGLAALTKLQLHETPALSGVVPAAVLSLPVTSILLDGTSVTIASSGDGQPFFPAAIDLRVDNARLQSRWPDAGSGDAMFLSLKSCGLQGTIPSQIGLRTLLKDLRASDNQLTGPIPSQLGAAPQLRALELDGNLLSGALPTELLRLESLVHLTLAECVLTGTLPTQLGLLRKTTMLSLHHNRFSGSIPSQLGNARDLLHLELQGNRLSSTLPTQLGLLTKLTTLHVGSCGLVGTIPPGLVSLPLLLVVVEDNRLEGTVPGTETERQLWLKRCDDSGLDESACHYTCAACSPGTVELVSCDWKGRGQWCAPQGLIVGSLAGAAVWWCAFHAAIRPKDGPVWQTVLRMAQGLYSTVELTLDVLFAAGATGIVQSLAIGLLLVVGVARLVLGVALSHRVRDNVRLAFLPAIAFACVVDMAVANPVLHRFGLAPAPAALVATVVLGLVEAVVEGILQLTVIADGNAGNVTIAAFVFSVASFCSLVLVSSVVLLARRHRQKYCSEQVTELVSLGPDEKQPPQEAPSSSHGKDGDNGDENNKGECDHDGGEGDHDGGDGGRRRRRWAVLCCLLSVVAVVSMARPHIPTNASTVAQVSLPGNTTTVGQSSGWGGELVTRAQPRGHGEVVVWGATSPSKQDSPCGSGLYAFNPPFVCALGQVFAVVDGLGNSNDLTLPDMVALIPDVILLVLQESVAVTIPTSIATLSELVVMAVSRIDRVPSQIGHLSALRVLDLDRATDLLLPSQLGALTALNTLRVRHWSAPLIPSQIGALTNLELLELRDVSLSLDSTLPSQLGQLTNVQTLVLSGRTLVGPIPSTIGNLRNLTLLDASLARLGGELPTQLGLLSALTFVDVGINALTGGAGSYLVALPTLQRLMMGNNVLSGPLFPQRAWQPSSDLSHLDASHNQFSGSLPTQLALATTLTFLAVNDNPSLAGTVPSQLALLQSLATLKLSGCAFAGALPSQLALMRSLVYVSLANNSLSGPLPKEMAQAQRDVWLRECDYSGVEDAECARKCPRCHFNQFKLWGCDDRGFGQYCLPFLVLLVILGTVAVAMRLAVRRLLRDQMSRLHFAVASSVSTIAVLHLVLDALFAKDAGGVLSAIAGGVLGLAVFLRLMLVVDELLFLQSRNVIELSERLKSFALAAMFCVVDPFVAVAVMEGHAKGKASKSAAATRTRVFAVLLVQDVPMLVLQTIATATTSGDIAVQALTGTCVSLCVLGARVVRARWANAASPGTPSPVPVATDV